MRVVYERGKVGHEGRLCEREDGSYESCVYERGKMGHEGRVL